MFLLSRYAGKFSIRCGPRWFMTAGPLIAGVSISRARTAAGRRRVLRTDLLPALLGFSVGLSLTVAPLTTTVLSDAGPGDAGIASGVNNAVARVAGLIAIAVIGVVASGGGDRLTVAGFHDAMLVTAALLVAGGVIGAVGIRNRRSASRRSWRSAGSRASRVQRPPHGQPTSANAATSAPPWTAMPGRTLVRSRYGLPAAGRTLPPSRYGFSTGLTSIASPYACTDQRFGPGATA